MDLIADILLVAGALGAGVYCFVLARRLSRFNDLESGVGGAVAVLSAQVDDMTRTLKAAQQTATKSTERLEALTHRAEGVSKRLELMMAAMHDLPETPAKAAAKTEAEEVSEALNTELKASEQPPEANAPVQEAPAAKAEPEIEAEVEAELEPEIEDDFDAEFELAQKELEAEEERLRQKAAELAKTKAKRQAAKGAAKSSQDEQPASETSAKGAPFFTRHVA